MVCEQVVCEDAEAEDAEAEEAGGTDLKTRAPHNCFWEKKSKFKESAHVCAVYHIGICPLWVFKGQQQEDEAATSSMLSGGVVLSRPEAITSKMKNVSL